MHSSRRRQTAVDENRRRLLFLAGDFPPDVGGIQRYCYELVRAVAARGVEATVVAPKRPGAGRIDARLGVPVLRAKGGGKVGLALAMARVLAGVTGRDDVQAVVASKWMPEGPAYWLADGGRLPPLVLIGHGREFVPEPGRPVRAWLQRRVLRLSRLCLANSNFTARQFLAAGVSQDRVAVIYGGVNIREISAGRGKGEAVRRRYGIGDAPLVITVARLVRRKGHDLVIRALAKLGREWERLRYAIIGDGPERGRLERLAAEAGLPDRVIFAGTVPDEELSAWYDACDVLVMPSRDVPGEPPEGLGLVYLEANAAGKPVIGARVGGVEDAIVHGETGMLVEPDDTDAVAAALATLLSTPDLAKRMGEKGRQRVEEQFTWDAVASRFLSAVEQLAEPD